MSRGAVDIVGVSHGFSSGGVDLPVLDNISVSARPGEFVALLGRSGSGKSTLLRLVAGLDRPLIGTVYADGVEVRGPHSSRALAFQDPTLLPWRTVRENLELGPLARKNLAGSAERVDEVLRMVNLQDFADTLPAQLSGGMAQRAALGRALVSDPDIFLLDEPLGRLDWLTRRQLQRELETLWLERRFTALLVTHDVDEAIILADRIVLLTPRPASVIAEIAVSLPRPRLPDTQAFVTLRRHVLDRLNDAETNPDRETTDA